MNITRMHAGVDISSTSVKIAAVKGFDADGKAVVVAAHVVPLKPGTVHAGEIKSIPAVAAAISQGLKDVGLSRARVTLGASHPDAEVYPRELLEGIPPYRRIAAMETSPPQHATRIPAAEASRSVYEFAEGFSEWDAEGKILVSVAETRQAEIRKLVEIASLAKLNLHAIDLAGAGTLRAFTNSFGHSGDIGVLVDVGATTTRILVRRGPYLSTLETLTLGGETITKAVMATGMDAADAEEFKLLARQAARHAPQVEQLGYGDSTDEQEGMSNADEAMLKAVGHLAGQVASALRSPRIPREIDSIGLTGLGAAAAGFTEALRQRTGVDHVSLWRPWVSVADKKRTQWLYTSADEDRKVSLVRLIAISTAVGLAAGGNLS